MAGYVIFGFFVCCSLVAASEVTKEVKVINVNLTDKDIVTGLVIIYL